MNTKMVAFAFLTLLLVPTWVKGQTTTEGTKYPIRCSRMLLSTDKAIVSKRDWRQFTITLKIKNCGNEPLPLPSFDAKDTGTSIYFLKNGGAKRYRLCEPKTPMKCKGCKSSSDANHSIAPGTSRTIVVPVLGLLGVSPRTKVFFFQFFYETAIPKACGYYQQQSEALEIKVED
jgi:hypothetical protein